MKYVRPFFGDQLRLGWVACWATDREYSVGWHRDVGNEERDGSYDVEMEILRRYRKYQIKWHLPMIDDSCLWYVPGSQRRYRTDAEREVLINNPDGGEIDGALQVTVKRGQTAILPRKRDTQGAEAGADKGETDVDGVVGAAQGGRSGGAG